MRRASACACSPAALTSTPAAISSGASPPTRSTKPSSRTTRALERRADDERAAGVLEVAQVGEHQRMAVDDAGHRGEQRRFAREGRLELARFGAAQPAQAFDAVAERAPLDRAQRLDLRRRRRDDELAAAPMADAARLAIGIEQAPAGDAEPRLQRAGRVVEAGVDDLAVARADAVADAGGRLRGRGSRGRAARARARRRGRPRRPRRRRHRRGPGAPLLRAPRRSLQSR